MAIEVFASVAGTVNEFIDWSLAIVSIMILWYIVKFFLVAPPTEAEKQTAEEKWAEKGAKGREEIKEKLKEREAKEGKLKKQQERERQAEDIEPIKGFLTEAIEECENLISALKDKDKDSAVSNAKSNLKKLKNNLKNAVYHLRHLRKKGDETFEFFDNLSTNGGLALSKAKEIELPKADAEDWNDAVRKIYTEVMGNEGIRVICAAILKALQTQKMVALKKAAAERVEEQVQEKVEQKEQQSNEKEGRVLRGRNLGKRGRKRVGSRPVVVVRKK